MVEELIGAEDDKGSSGRGVVSSTDSSRIPTTFPRVDPRIGNYTGSVNMCNILFDARSKCRDW